MGTLAVNVSGVKRVIPNRFTTTHSMHSLIRKVVATSMHDMLYRPCVHVKQVSDSADATGSDQPGYRTVGSTPH